MPPCLHSPYSHVSSAAMKRILNRYIFREISTLFLLGIVIFTLILLMGRLIKLTELVVSRGVPLTDVGRMILYLMPSFLVFTIPMAFLLAVLLAFGRLSADNEITVMKSCGISLTGLMPAVLVCALLAGGMTLTASTIGIPWGNGAFKTMSGGILKQNVSATIREKVFWDDIPGIVLYTEHYDEERRALNGVVIHDGRDTARPLTIFASSGLLAAGKGKGDIRLVLNSGSIHSPGASGEYRLVRFGEYIMSISGPGGGEGGSRNELDMTVPELLRASGDPALSRQQHLKAESELHSRFALPFATLVFAVVAVPLGMQNRRSGKSAGFSTSIGILLAYYIVQSLLRTLAEKGTLPPAVALWLPNLLFLGLGCYLLKMASHERETVFARLAVLLASLWGGRKP